MGIFSGVCFPICPLSLALALSLLLSLLLVRLVRRHRRLAHALSTTDDTLRPPPPRPRTPIRCHVSPFSGERLCSPQGGFEGLSAIILSSSSSSSFLSSSSFVFLLLWVPSGSPVVFRIALHTFFIRLTGHHGCAAEALSFLVWSLAPSSSSFLCCLLFRRQHTHTTRDPPREQRPVWVISPAPIQVLGRGGPRGRRVGPLQVSRRVASSLVFWVPQGQPKRFVSRKRRVLHVAIHSHELTTNLRLPLGIFVG